jgi:flavin-dependent dehydrogenase
VGALRDAGEGGGWIVRQLDRLIRSEAGEGFLGTDASASRVSVWPIPTELRRGDLIGGAGRVLFAGDAVGATDPMTGEGIAEALQTGMLAAEALAAGTPDTYVASAGRALVRRHRRRQLCSDLLRSRLLAEAGLKVAGANGWTRAQFTRWIFD